MTETVMGWGGGDAFIFMKAYSLLLRQNLYVLCILSSLSLRHMSYLETVFYIKSLSAFSLKLEEELGQTAYFPKENAFKI